MLIPTETHTWQLIVGLCQGAASASLGFSCGAGGTFTFCRWVSCNEFPLFAALSLHCLFHAGTLSRQLFHQRSFCRSCSMLKCGVVLPCRAAHLSLQCKHQLNNCDRPASTWWLFKPYTSFVSPHCRSSEDGAALSRYQTWATEFSLRRYKLWPLY